jgi:hypothetical protein
LSQRGGPKPAFGREKGLRGNKIFFFTRDLPKRRGIAMVYAWDFSGTGFRRPGVYRVIGRLKPFKYFFAGRRIYPKPAEFKRNLRGFCGLSQTGRNFRSAPNGSKPADIGRFSRMASSLACRSAHYLWWPDDDFGSSLPQKMNVSYRIKKSIRAFIYYWQDGPAGVFMTCGNDIQPPPVKRRPKAST